MSSAADYIREAATAERYEQDCVAHACRIAELLLAERREPWIGRIRDVQGNYHGPLIPLRYLGKGAPTWTTHYVACAGREVFDPLAGEPVEVDRYTIEVFGRKLDVVEHFDAGETQRLLQSGEFLQAFRPR